MDSPWAGTPDLAIEVRSKNDRWSEILEKVAGYLRYGSPLVWVIDPKKQDVVVFRHNTEPATLTLADELNGGDVVPGFRFPVIRLFE